MHLLVTLAITLSGVLPGALPTRVWTAPSLDNIGPQTEPPYPAAAEIRLYAAPGERESFQVCVHPSKDLRDVRLEGGGLDGDEIPKPDVYRVAFLPEPGGPGQEQAAPDRLVLPDASDLPADQTTAFWVTYTLSQDTPPGLYEGRLRLCAENTRTFSIPVTLEVFGFQIPEEPALRTLAMLDRDALRRVYAIEGEALDDWSPYYDAFGGMRLSLSLWQSDGLVSVAEDSIDTTRFKEHLGYVAPALHMNTINLASSTAGLSVLPSPSAPHQQDPLEIYLHEMKASLGEQENDAVVLPAANPPREYWESMQELYLRIWRADSAVPRIMTGPLHPNLETFADIWAIPLKQYHPLACGRLRQGMSLAADPAYPLREIRSHSQRKDTRVRDAYDGSLFSAWIFEDTPGRAHPETLDLSLTESVRTEVIKIGWLRGYEGRDIGVQTAYGGGNLTNATVEWRHLDGHGPYAFSCSIGTFKVEKRFDLMRISIHGSEHGGEVGITEIEFDQPPSPETISKIEPVEVWLSTRDGAYPRVNHLGDPVEPRALAWVCWDHQFEGVLLPSVNDWASLPASSAEPCPLFYPGPEGPMPSIRAERLRDGMEDYEYLVALDRATQRGVVSKGAAQGLLARMDHDPEPSADALAKLRTRIERVRVEIGRLLSAPQGWGKDVSASEGAGVEETGQ